MVSVHSSKTLRHLTFNFLIFHSVSKAEHNLSALYFKESYELFGVRIFVFTQDLTEPKLVSNILCCQGWSLSPQSSCLYLARPTPPGLIMPVLVDVSSLRRVSSCEEVWNTTGTFVVTL